MPRSIRNDVFKNAYDIIHALAGATLAAGEEDKISKFAPMPEDDDNVIANKLKSAMAEAGRSQAIMSRLTGNEQELSSSVPEGINSEQWRWYFCSLHLPRHSLALSAYHSP